MTQRAKRLEQLFEELVDLRAEDREVVLSKECADDNSLAIELRELLSCHDKDESSPDFLGTMTGSPTVDHNQTVDAASCQP